MKQQYNAMVNGEYIRKFTKNYTAPMNGIWVQFNNYAKKKGFTEMVEGHYLGGVAWKAADGRIMEIKIAE